MNMDDTYHRSVARSKLTRNIAATFDQVHDELVGALEDFIPTTSQGTSYMLLESTPMLYVQRRVGQGIYLTNHATYRLSGI